MAIMDLKTAHEATSFGCAVSIWHREWGCQMAISFPESRRDQPADLRAIPEFDKQDKIISYEVLALTPDGQAYLDLVT